MCMAVLHDELDAAITKEKVKLAVGRMSCGKAAGLDNMLTYLGFSTNDIVPFLTKLFLEMYDGQYLDRVDFIQ